MASALKGLRQPEYTGENRCLPCTAVNVVIAIAAGVVAATLVPFGFVGAVATGGVVLAGAVVVIYLRGYLVPGTPRLTTTYAPDWILRSFEHPSRSAEEPVRDLVPTLVEADVVTECETVDDLCLTDDFRAVWHARMDARPGIEACLDDLAALLELPPEDLEVESYGTAVVAQAASDPEGPSPAGTVRVGKWESAGAFLADMAAVGPLKERIDGWAGLSPDERGHLVSGVRIFLERCPTCGGPVEFGEETVGRCCLPREVVTVRCTECGGRLFEADPAPVVADL